MPDPLASTVGALMRTHFITLSSGDSLYDAGQVMRLARVRLLPVVEAGRYLGLLSNAAVLELALASRSGGEAPDRLLRRVPAGARADATVAALHPGASLVEAAARMLEAEVACLPVVAEGAAGPRLVGLVTEADLLRAACARDRAVAAGA